MGKFGASLVTFVALVTFVILEVYAMHPVHFTETYRVKRGAAYAGGYGGANGAPKLTPSVALGTYGGFADQPHGGYQGKLTVQEALGQYGSFVRSAHQGPTTIGNDAQIFNKH